MRFKFNDTAFSDRSSAPMSSRYIIAVKLGPAYRALKIAGYLTDVRRKIGKKRKQAQSHLWTWLRTPLVLRHFVSGGAVLVQDKIAC
ncbi:hypothetical protein [Parasitella parasitica]|uniref:Uncharacterized protein n=1 Tax=Parasitella parasitica TaxID=35722 RepID=A0A0B7MQR1_9FUNG|nr:hypothetical protein [Parasitella parasitica]